MDQRFANVSPTGDFNANPLKSFSPHMYLSALQAVRLPEQGDVEGTNGSSTQGRLSKRSRLQE